MKYSRRWLVKTLIVISVIFCAGCASQNSEYPPPGRDTVEWYGNGRYEITSSTFGDYRQYALFDRKGAEDGVEAVEGNILIYKQYETRVYVIGLAGKEGQYEEYEEEILTLEKMPERIVYTKFDYEKEELWQSEELSDFSDEDKMIFQELLNGKTLFE